MVRRFLAAGLLDEIRLHVVPPLLGGGVRLFDDVGGRRVALEPPRVVVSDRVTHRHYRV